MRGLTSLRVIPFLAIVCVGVALAAEAPPGEGPAMGDDRISQQQIESGRMGLREIRQAGLRVFSMSFNRWDGYGDGPFVSADPDQRPTLQGNSMFLRVNGLDAQSCLECHSLVSSASVPPTLGIGGAGGSNSNAIIMPTAIDVADLDDLDGVADFDGRFANPPFLFGVGGVELLAAEMTMDLQALKTRALEQPGVTVELVTKGVSFGRVRADLQGDLDTSEIEGIDHDLVVRPFGRKGEFATTREFDQGAMQFHFGMQPVEVVGEGIDADEDGVADEIRVGELSAIGVFLATLERPRRSRPTGKAIAGRAVFNQIGCASCHIPSLKTNNRTLPLRFPEVPTDPTANIYYGVDLRRPPASFRRSRSGGLIVPLFADLKRHDMGPGLAESFVNADEATNRRFTTAKLWGVADSAPYLHDGRATTLSDAILFHGGEAQAARDAFADLGAGKREAILAFLRTLRTPRDPARDLIDSRRHVDALTSGTHSPDDESDKSAVALRE